MTSGSADELELGDEPAAGSGVPGQAHLDPVVRQPPVRGVRVLHRRVERDEHHGGVRVRRHDRRTQHGALRLHLVVHHRRPYLRHVLRELVVELTGGPVGDAPYDAPAAGPAGCQCHRPPVIAADHVLLLLSAPVHGWSPASRSWFQDWSPASWYWPPVPPSSSGSPSGPVTRPVAGSNPAT